MELGPAREALRKDTTLVGSALCRAYSDLVDGWLAGLLEQAESATGPGASRSSRSAATGEPS